MWIDAKVSKDAVEAPFFSFFFFSLHVGDTIFLAGRRGGKALKSSGVGCYLLGLVDRSY